jgi:hypothetical protein
LITDGQSPSDRAHELRQRADALGVTVLGIGIGIDPGVLKPWCDHVYGVTDLERLDERAAHALFTM